MESLANLSCASRFHQNSEVTMQISPYPYEPGAKVCGTSTDAAVEMKKKAPTLRAEVLALLRLPAYITHGLTADRAAAILNESVLSIRPRFSELLEMGQIRDSGKRRANQSGKMATVWVAALVGEQITLF